MKKEFDREFYIRRNKDVAMARYGPYIMPDRTVRGTDIWFDENWVIHEGRQGTCNEKEKIRWMDKC